MASTELAEAWYESEAITIQEGNFLSAIAKEQRLLISSDFVRGIRLYDFDNKINPLLVEFGREFNILPNVHHGLGVVVHQTSIFSFIATKRLNGERNIIAAFLIQPNILVWSFSGITAVILFFLIAGFYLIKKIELAEFARRKLLVRTALDNLVEGQPPSALLTEYSKSFVSHWDELKQKLDEMKERERQLAAEATLGEIAKQVAHDIRSPLSALNALASRIKFQSSDQNKIYLQIIKRLETIAEDVLSRKPPILRDESSPVIDQQWPIQHADLLNINDVIYEAVMMKKSEYLRLKEFKIKTFLSGEPANVRFPKNDFFRILSNLMNNSIEARRDEFITLTISTFFQHNRVVMELRDNGKGIPQEIMPKIGKREFSYQKTDGNGLGLYHAFRSVEANGGTLHIYSSIDTGTTITITLPQSN
jgi:signal transduction histidine kinase